MALLKLGESLQVGNIADLLWVRQVKLLGLKGALARVESKFAPPQEYYDEATRQNLPERSEAEYASLREERELIREKISEVSAEIEATLAEMRDKAML